MKKHHIEWLNYFPGYQGETWNPFSGCSVVSPGCTNCYAMRLAGTRLKHLPLYKGITSPSKAGPVFNGTLRVTNDDVWTRPLKWKKPRVIFVGDMADLFHEDRPDDVIDRVYATAALCPQHIFLVLTKRAKRMHEYMKSIDDNRGGRLDGFRDALVEGMAQKIYHDITDDDPSMWLAVSLPLPNVWHGCSVENEEQADERIPLLLDTPSAKRFISAEPPLGKIDIQPFIEYCHAARDGECFAKSCPQLRDDEPAKTGRHCPIDNWDSFYETDEAPPHLDWVIAGGESGPGARPSHPDWYRDLRDQCAAANVPYFFKQWGEWRCVWIKTAPGNIKSHEMRHIGKKAAGRLLDGREHNDCPEV